MSKKWLMKSYLLPKQLGTVIGPIKPYKTIAVYK